MEELFIEIGNAIKAARKEKKMTMQELAQQVGLSQSAISMIENGLRHPSIQTLQKFSQVLHIDLSMIVKKRQATEQTNTNVKQTEATPLQLKTQDFTVDLLLRNFTCTYNDPDIQEAIEEATLSFITNILEDPYVLAKLDEHMKQTIEQTLKLKQQELNKLYNRLNL